MRVFVSLVCSRMHTMNEKLGHARTERGDVGFGVRVCQGRCGMTPSPLGSGQFFRGGVRVETGCHFAFCTRAIFVGSRGLRVVRRLRILRACRFEVLAGGQGAKSVTSRSTTE